jgi:hypothetical protein
MTTEKTPRRTFLWGLMGPNVTVRDAFAFGFGQLRDTGSVATARAAERILGPDHERRWRWLMPRRTRRRLVVAMVGTWVLVIAAGLTPASLVPGFVLSAGAYVLLRQASRALTDLPDRYLDERQLEIRNEAFTTAYKILAGVLAMGIAGTLAWMYGVEAGRGFSLSDLPFDLRLAALWVFVWAVQSLPAAVLLWREPDPMDLHPSTDESWTNWQPPRP